MPNGESKNWVRFCVAIDGFVHTITLGRIGFECPILLSKN